jgi:hypothetical protein
MTEYIILIMSYSGFFPQDIIPAQSGGVLGQLMPLIVFFGLLIVFGLGFRWIVRRDDRLNVNTARA